MPMLRSLTVAALAASASAFVAPITTGRVTGTVSFLSLPFLQVDFERSSGQSSNERLPVDVCELGALWMRIGWVRCAGA
eukprot:454812-Rhodomonas_salina.1